MVSPGWPPHILLSREWTWKYSRIRKKRCVGYLPQVKEEPLANNVSLRPDPVSAPHFTLFIHLRIGPVTLVGSSLWVTYAGFTPGLSPFGDVASWTPGVGWIKRLAADVVIHAMTSTSSTVALLASPTEQPNSTSESFMYISAQGTGEWHSSGTLTCPSDSSIVDSMAGTGSTFLAECVGSFEAGWAARSYWLTTDDGATWTMRARDSAQANLKAGIPPFGEAGTMTQDGGHFWVAVTRSTLYSSSDNGLTWQAATGLNKEASAFSGTVTFNGPDGWCAYFGLGVWRTADGGSTWEELGQSGLG